MDANLDDLMKQVEEHAANTAHKEKMQTFALNVDKWRVANGISQAEIARRMGYSDRSMNKYTYLNDNFQRYANSEIPPIKTLLRLALALGVDVVDFVPEGFDLTTRLGKNENPEHCLSVEAFVLHQLEQLFQYRDRIVLHFKQRGQQNEAFMRGLVLENVVHAVMRHYAALESVEANEKCATLSNVVKRFCREVNVGEYTLESLLASLLELYFSYDRPEEDAAHWAFGVQIMMGHIKSWGNPEPVDNSSAVPSGLTGDMSGDDVTMADLFGGEVEPEPGEQGKGA